MGAHRVRTVYLTQMTLVTIGVTLGGAAIFKWLLPCGYIPSFPVIPLFNFLFSLAYVCVFCFFRREFPEKVTLFYLAAKVVKMLMAFVIIGVYCYFDQENRVFFSLMFFAGYMVYLVFDSVFFVTHEVRQKNKNKK